MEKRHSEARKSGNGGKDRPPRYRWRPVDYFAIISVTAWAASMIAAIFVPKYQPPPTINAVPIAAAGAAFGYSIWKGRNGNGH